MNFFPFPTLFSFNLSTHTKSERILTCGGHVFLIATKHDRENLERDEQSTRTCSQSELFPPSLFPRLFQSAEITYTSESYRCDFQAKSKYETDAIQINSLHAQASLLQGRELDKVNPTLPFLLLPASYPSRDGKSTHEVVVRDLGNFEDG